MRIAEGNKWKAVFICKYGLYDSLVMFFGLTNSPATFQSMMNEIFHLEILQGWLNDYLDDILLGNGGDRSDLTIKTLQVLDKCEENDLYVRPEKSLFFVEKVDFLGFNVENGKVLMEEQKVAGIADWPPPQTVTQVRSFLGFCNYYRRFISHFAEICEPLQQLTRKTTPWEWTVE